MENFYKISKAQADLLGRFEYATNQAFDPYCSEQKDGNYLVSEQIYILLKTRMEFQKIDFTKQQKIDEAKVDTKPIII